MTNAISAQGLALIQAHEGFRAEPAQLPDGAWVVGYSHVRAEAGEPLNQTEAADLLAIDVAPFEKLVNVSVTQPVNQSQFDALVSFAFSVGAQAFADSQVLRRVNSGDVFAAACAMDAWRKSDVGGELEVVDALVRRRAAEKALFLQDVSVDATPSAFVRAKLDHAAAILGAPVKYAQAPAVGSIPMAQPKPASAAVLTEILKSEPATEALLLTQVVADDFVEEEGEIVTAHAKPVARSLDEVREATRRAYAAQDAEPKKSLFAVFERKDGLAVDQRIRAMRRRAERKSFALPNLSGGFEHLGLIALLLFGVGLLMLAATLAFGGQPDIVGIAGAAALAAPGFAASLIAAFGLRRAPAKA